MIERRSFITGLIALVAAPAIVRAGSLMPVKQMVEPVRAVARDISMPALRGMGLRMGDIITFSGTDMIANRQFVVTYVADDELWFYPGPDGNGKETFAVSI